MSEPDGTGPRLARMRAQFGEWNVGALLLTHPASVRWLSEFTSPEDARVLVTPDAAWLLTDGRYTVQAEQESTLPAVIDRDWVAAVEARAGDAVLGVEGHHLTLAAAAQLRDRLGTEPTVLAPDPARLRVVKDDEEVDRLRRAAAITDVAFEAALETLAPGVREWEVAHAIERSLREQGAEGAAFDILVASGPRGAMPHGVASDRTVQAGDLVTLDMGARYRGYCADMTRTVAVGRPSEVQERWHAAVLDALRAASEATRAGRSGRELDEVARASLRARGLEDAFVHSLGHGVGLDVHEGPRLARTSDDVLEAGMTVTLEPGVYLPGEGGVRIEDLVHVTERGVEVLSNAPRELVSVP